MTPPRDRREDRIACLVFGALSAVFALVLHWLGAPLVLVRAMAIASVAYAVAGLFGPLWWLRNVLLFQYRAS